MGFLSEVWALATETPVERRLRLERQGPVTKRATQQQTSHPDDAGHSGLDQYTKKKARR